MNFKSLFLSTISAISLTAGAAQAEMVNLHAPDGSIDLEGTFVEYADGRYVVETALGLLRVKASRVVCLGDPCPTFDIAKTDVRVMVSDRAEYELALQLIQAFAVEKGGKLRVYDTPHLEATFADFAGKNGKITSLAIAPASDERSFVSLDNGAADVSFSSRPSMSDRISNELFAIEPFVVVTHTQMPIRELHIDQIRQVISGNITNWSELGGEDRPIALVRMGQDQTPASLETIGDGTLDLALADDSTLGLVPLADAGSMQRMKLVDSCGASNEPDRFAVKTGRYPFSENLYIHRSSDLVNTEARDFLSFALSENAAGILNAHGLFRPGLEVASMDAEGSRAQALSKITRPRSKAAAAKSMLSMMEDYQILSKTFRFSTGSASIDHLAADDFSQLADYLAGLPAGTRVRFVGFSDQVGTFRKNSRLSLARASEIASAVQRIGGVKLQDLNIESIGFGELAPVSCNSDETGRSLNRRVEVWIDSSLNREMQAALDQ